MTTRTELLENAVLAGVCFVGCAPNDAAQGLGRCKGLVDRARPGIDRAVEERGGSSRGAICPGVLAL